MDYYRQQQQYHYPFPFPFPSPPQPQPPADDIRRRLTQVERTVERHTERLNRLNRRLRRVEQQLGYPYTSDY